MYRLGAGDEEFRDFSGMQLKPDHYNRWGCRAGRAAGRAAGVLDICHEQPGLMGTASAALRPPTGQPAS